MWSSHAAHRKVSYSGLHTRQPHRAVVLHTNGGGTDRGSLFGLWSGNASGRNGYDNRHIGAQFQITTAGHAEQYVDTDVVVYHAYSASEWAVGIETEDDGHPAAPWTPAQCNTIIAICHELEVPGQLLLSTPSDGLGWHEQYLAWNREKHSCPGHVREQQIHDVILPALRQPAPKPHHPPAPKPPAPAVPHWYSRLLTVRSPYLHGGDVEIVQKKVHAKPVDGIYGPMTALAVRAFQKQHHLQVDGIVGPATATALGA